MLTKDDYIKLSAELINKNAEKFFSGLIKFGKDKYSKALVNTKDAFNEYLDTAINRFSAAKTILFKQTVYLYDIYVRTNLLYEEEFDDIVIDTNDINNIFSKGKSLIITGSGGCGKSTLLKHLFLNSIENCNSVPIFIELKDIKDFDNSVEFIDFIYASLSSMNFSLDKEYFEYSLKHCNIIMFFDGFDEINDENKLKVNKEILKLSIKYKNLYTIITSRPLENGFTSWTNFHEFSIMPMEKDQSLELISKIKYDKTIKNNFLSDLDNTLYNNFTSFASNPLLLTIMLITYTEYAEIPDKMHLFFEEAFEVLYRKHDANKEGVLIRPFKSGLSKDVFENILSCFSLLSYYDNHFSFRKNEIIEYIDKTKNITKLSFDSNAYLSDLIQSVCIIQIDGLMYDFTHRSFQEYFTAKYILKSSNTIQKKLLNRLPPRFISDNVLSLLFDMNKSMVEENLIIPKLNEINEKISFDSSTLRESIVNFLNTTFDTLKIIKIRNRNGIGNDEINSRMLIRFSLRSTKESKDQQYYQLVSFVFKKYSNNSIVQKSISIDKVILKQYTTFNDIDILLTDDTIYNAFINTNAISYYLEFSMYQYKQLILEHQIQESSIDSLLLG